MMKLLQNLYYVVQNLKWMQLTVHYTSLYASSPAKGESYNSCNINLLSVHKICIFQFISLPINNFLQMTFFSLFW